jgi:hypothetical protein
MASGRQQPTETDTLLVKHVAVGKPCPHHDQQVTEDGSAVKASQERSREQPPSGGQHEAVQRSPDPSRREVVRITQV